MYERLLRLEEKGPVFWTVAGLLIVAVVSYLDILSGYEFAFSLFYLIPISLTARFSKKSVGIIISAASAFGWILADTLTGHPYSSELLPVLNTVIRFSVFLIVALLVSALKKSYEQEKDLARIDNLTGAVNERFFKELVQIEIDRSERTNRPFTTVYIDLDNFKQINDKAGHGEGDKVLKTTVTEIKNHLRKMDFVARLGGDEFALFLPETDQDNAKIAMKKVNESLLNTMKDNKWDVTFSIGVLTCVQLPESTEELITKADKLMYEVKKKGKNAVTYAYFSEDRL